jgi:hypothetical protein
LARIDSNTHLTKVSNGETHARIIIRALDDVELTGSLKNNEETRSKAKNERVCVNANLHLVEMEYLKLSFMERRNQMLVAILH